METYVTKGMGLTLRSKASVCIVCQFGLRRLVTGYAQDSVQRWQPTFRYALSSPDKIAIKDQHGEYSYRGIFNSSKKLADTISAGLNAKLQERVAFLCPNDATYVITQWACWMSGQIAVPLSPSHPVSMLEYFISDSDAKMVITTREYRKKLQSLSAKLKSRFVVLDSSLLQDAMILSAEQSDSRAKPPPPALKGGLNPNMYNKLDAMIIYTSGSTAAPKGVVLTFENLSAQTSALISAWGWSENDTILHALPLHHMHGIVNALLCPLQCGARCLMLPKFDPKVIWRHLLGVKVGDGRRVTVFMGVPTMYVKLIQEYERSLNTGERISNYIKATCSQKIRLMVSGSAPLPDSVFERWREITGHSLLERYGMSETGMVLSNPLNGPRKQGFVGNPLPGVSVRITDGKKILVEGDEKETRILSSNIGPNACVGELLVKGDNVFKEYWRKPEATAKEFTNDGWFKTGDTAQYIDNSYKILGRTSIDIIKSGGYKISALFVETKLLEHPYITDAAVFGLPDPTWGQKVAAVVVLQKGKELSILALNEWLKEKVPPYVIPSVLKIVPSIPRNLMGKVNKKELVKELFPDIIM